MATSFIPQEYDLSIALKSYNVAKNRTVELIPGIWSWLSGLDYNITSSGHLLIADWTLAYVSSHSE